MASVDDRVRAYVLLKVSDPHKAAAAIEPLLTQGGDDWVIVRADVVEGDHNLVVPVDVAVEWFDHVRRILGTAVGAEPAILRVIEHHPEPTHAAHCFIKAEEHRRFPLHEYTPPGRHPKSPGANPWG